ncbi:MAG: 3-hydroxyacyl-CoA dehydrogenase [Planctomycetes bacterium]|nr:3-hydroxyacyl-CoA dehydrogenase [Planctomycetota bacterium]
MFIYKAGVVGAGLMGSGIAQVISFSGLPVVLKDVSKEFVDKGLAAARKVYEARVKKGKMSAEELEQKMALITGSTSWDDFSDVDIVIEAVPEDLALKKEIFAALDRVCPEHAILATNTSALSVSAIASATKRPDKVVGIHFFYPAPVMKLIEVIPGLETSPETMESSLSFSESLRKIAVKVKECDGFLVNRLLMPYLNEAVYALAEGSATAKEIDDAMVAFGMPMGPFTLADNLGLDTCYHVGNILHEAYGERAKASPLMNKLFAARCYGTKTGCGFYVYDDRESPLPRFLDEVRKETGVTRGSFTPERLIYPMINEAAFCLEENVATPTDIDVSMLAGTGFPQAKGGLLRYADTVGVDAVLAGLLEFRSRYGARFWPCPLLRRMVGAGHVGAKGKKGFFDTL